MARHNEATKGATDSGCLVSAPGNRELSKTPMISIVDDDESVRESTKALVRSFGYNARIFASAEDFLDANLDERRTPIIFVTAFPDERTRNHALDAGAIGFLSKPFSDDKLTKCLYLALANRIS